LGQSVDIVGRRTNDRPVGAFVALADGVQHVRLRWENPYGPGEIQIDDVELSFLAARQAPQPHPPAGAVGLMAADQRQLPRLLGEMLQHHDHYCRTAASYSRQWMQKHAPHNTFATLLACGANANAAGRAVRAA
jgi:hypothetical protein